MIITNIKPTMINLNHLLHNGKTQKTTILPNNSAPKNRCDRTFDYTNFVSWLYSSPYLMDCELHKAKLTGIKMSVQIQSLVYQIANSLYQHTPYQRQPEEHLVHLILVQSNKETY